MHIFVHIHICMCVYIYTYLHISISPPKMIKRDKDLGKDFAEATKRGKDVIFREYVILAVCALYKALEKEACRPRGLV